MERRDETLDTLLDLDGQVLVLDEDGDYWVKFEVRRAAITPERPHGLAYSLTLHGKDNGRLVGFDNAHAARYSSRPGGKGPVAYEHKHRLRSIRPYQYRNAAELPADFWTEVDEVLKEASKDPRAALLLLSSKIDSAVRERFEEAQIDIRYGSAILRFPPTQQAIELGIEKGIFPPSALSAYQEFRIIRNKIAHEYTFKVDTDTILSVISLGTQLLKVLSTEKPDGKKEPPT